LRCIVKFLILRSAETFTTRCGNAIIGRLGRRRAKYSSSRPGQPH